MSLHSINITVAKAQLSALLKLVEENNQEIIIERAGKPIAKLTKYKADPVCNRIGFAKGLIVMSENYNDPLPDDIALSLGMRD